jgi:hypothetical protein
MQVGFQPFGKIPLCFLRKQVRRSSPKTNTNFHLKCHFYNDFSFFHLQIERKILGVLGHSGIDEYNTYSTFKLGGNPHTIQLFLLEAKGRIPTQKERIVQLDDGDKNVTYIIN